MRNKILYVFVCCSISVIGQNLVAKNILDNSIAFHDPNGKWEQFNATFQVIMTTPNNPKRVSDITINLPEEYFSVNAVRDSMTTQYILDKENCTTNVIDSLQPADARKPCETAKLYKDYYTYLYGLPMKLKDPGANLTEKVETVNFHGKEYLKLKVTYDEAVGKDVWFFYFNPENYALEAYQFYKGEPKGDGKNTGEYILLSESLTVNGVKMPRIRKWYYNKDDKYLGTDTITRE